MKSSVLTVSRLSALDANILSKLSQASSDLNVAATVVGICWLGEGDGRSKKRWKNECGS